MTKANEKQSGRGGARTGAGRPKAPASVPFRVMLPAVTAGKVLERGGNVWIKRLIDEAIKAAA